MEALNHKIGERLLRELAHALSTGTGETFFREIAQWLSRTLEMPMVFVGDMCRGDPQRVHAIITLIDGEFLDPISYPLADGPCETVYGRTVRVYPRGAAERFPNDAFLSEYRVESYAGAPLFSASGAPLGLVCALGREPLKHPELVTSLLQIVAVRIGAELERMRAEQVIRDREERYRVTFEKAALGVAHVALDGHFLLVNERFCALLGYSRAELLERSFRDITHPDDLAGSADLVNSMLSGPQRHFAMEKRYIRKDGATLWGRITSALVRGEDDSPQHFISVLEDITERRTADEALRRSQQRLAALVEHTPLAVLVWNSRSEIMEWNPAAERIFGYSASEVLGRHWHFLVPETARTQVGDVFRNLWANAGGYRSTNENLTKDGRLIQCEWYNSPLISPTGEVIGVASLCQDVTDRARLEQQLRHAQKMEAIGRLAGGVAHDFNNLLTALLGYADLAARDASLTSAARAAIDGIRHCAARATSLTKQLLTFGRKSVLQPQDIDLNAVVVRMSEMLGRLIGEPIALTLRLSADPATVHVDPSQLEQVILNLALNARDAMSNGGELTIETGNESLGHRSDAARGAPTLRDYVTLRVRDTGVGMNEEILAHIFEPFFTTKEVGAGTGLGLATVQGIVEQSGGVVEVHSRPGAGTNFAVFLPLVNRTPSPHREIDYAPNVRGGRETILIVEDEGVVRELFAQALRTKGYTVIEAANGADALQIAAQPEVHIDLLLTDVSLPRMSGVELAVRFAAQYPETKLLIMSGNMERALAARNPLPAAAAFLEKPFRPDHLAHRIRELLDAAPVEQSAARSPFLRS